MIQKLGKLKIKKMEKFKEVTQDMRDALKKPLPSEAVKPHPTKTYLSSIKAIYVVERLNDVFGIGSWKSRVEKESVGDNGMVVVKLIFEIPSYGIYHESYGGNDNGGENSKNFDLGDAYKGATTDALTKICSFLEIGIDVFKGLSTPTSSPNTATKEKEPSGWLNLFDKDGQETETFRKLRIEVDGGANYTLAQVRKKYKVSKQTAAELEKYFAIK